MSSKRRPGDWMCPNCDFLIFASKSCCKKCGATKQGKPGVNKSNKYGGGGNRRKNKKYGKSNDDEWICSNCSSSNYSDRNKCRKCKTNKAENNSNNSYIQQQQQQQQQISAVNQKKRGKKKKTNKPENNSNNSYIQQISAINEKKRAKKKKTGKKLRSRETANIPRSKMRNNVEIDSNVNEEDFLQSVQSAYGASARVEINSTKSNYNNNNNRQQISYQVVFDDEVEAQQAYKQNDILQQQVATNLGIKGSTLAFDKVAEPKSIDGITLQLDSDTSSILCGACLIYDYNDKCLKTVHYSDKNYMNVIKHSGDTKVHGKSVHTIKLSLSDLNKTVKQLFFTLCACGPSDLSQFKEPVISLYENNEEDINLIQYGIEQAAKSRSVVMCRLFRSDDNNNDNNNNWSIQALGSKEWHIAQKVCMAYHNAKSLIDAHLKIMKQEDDKSNDKENDSNKDKDEEKDDK